MQASSTLWLVLALIALGLEFATGTFYLLVMALALAGGGLSAWLGWGSAWQFGVASLSGLLGLVIVTRWRRQTRRASNPQSDDPDLGQEVRVLRLTDPGYARVFYRGAEWDAQCLGTPPQAGQLAYIIGRDGNHLKISITPAGNA